MRYALEINRKDAEKYINDSILILPLGSLEQHGPHLPLGTDSYTAEEISVRVASKIDNSVILPLLPYGYAWVWKDIPLTISLREKTLKELIKDIAFSVYRFKPRALLVINGHLANESALKYAARDIADEIPLKLFYFSLPEIDKFPMDSKPSELTIHAEEIETSLMLTIRPELVNMKSAFAEYPKKPKSYGCSALSLGSLSKSGVFGDPSVATKEKGELYMKIMVNYIIEVLKDENIIQGG
ncbi:MAG: creatininase family protein [Nitrososphaeria archaeon]